VIERPPAPTGSLFALLVVDAVLLGAFGLIFTPLYAGAVPLPLGALLSALVLPWLVLRCGELSRTPRAAGAPVLAWLVTIGVLGLVSPGGDVMLPQTWQSLLLIVSGLGTGLLAVRHVIEAGPRGKEIH
jgi:hypothetical protein